MALLLICEYTADALNPEKTIDPQVLARCLALNVNEGRDRLLNMCLGKGWWIRSSNLSKTHSQPFQLLRSHLHAFNPTSFATLGFSIFVPKLASPPTPSILAASLLPTEFSRAPALSLSRHRRSGVTASGCGVLDAAPGPNVASGGATAMKATLPLLSLSPILRAQAGLSSRIRKNAMRLETFCQAIPNARISCALSMLFDLERRRLLDIRFGTPAD